MARIAKIVRVVKQGPAGPATPAAMIAASQAMTSEQRTAFLAVFGFVTYADREAANGTAGVANGDVFLDASDNGRPKIATE
jgi:hypothetical protein